MQKNQILCKYCGVILAFGKLFRKLIVQQLWLKHDKGNFNRCNFLFFKAPHCVMRCQCVKLEVVVTHTSVTLLAQILSDCLFGLNKNKCTSSADSHFKNVREEAKALKWLFALVNP